MNIWCRCLMCGHQQHVDSKLSSVSVGGKCPECGGSKMNMAMSTTSDKAPDWYLPKLDDKSKGQA
jgi:hypothetical protein